MKEKLIFALPLLLAATLMCPRVFAWNFTPQDVTHLHHRKALTTFSYGNSSRQFAKLRLPKSGKKPYPVAIIIHGGGWKSKFASIQYTEALADALTDLGFATWNIEYRTIDDAPWPATFKDTADAADYLKKIAPKYHLDLNKVVAIGHSAGGHLALWLGARHNMPHSGMLYRDNPLKLESVISMGGCLTYRNFRK